MERKSGDKRAVSSGDPSPREPSGSSPLPPPPPVAAVATSVLKSEGSSGTEPVMSESVKAFFQSQPFAQQPTLGQIADKFVERRGSGKREAQHSDGSEEEDEVEAEAYTGTAAATAESTGRWTRQEHELFLEALKKYGKEWKKVASMVKTRTVVQTRTHAQKYFQKLAKATGGSFENTDELLAVEKNSKKSSAAGISRKVRRTEMQSSPSYGTGLGLPIVRELPTNEPMILPPTYVFKPEQFLPMSETFDHSTHNSSTSAFTAPTLHLPIFLSSYRDLAQPSPAACGRRRQAELKAAQMLAGSSASSIDMEGAKLLSQMREEQSNSVSLRRGKSFLSLSILHPDNLQVVDHPSGEPGTPWDTAIQALANRSFDIAEHANNGNNKMNVAITTPSEQRHFLSTVRSLVQQGDLANLGVVLNAAEVSAESHLQSMRGEEMLGPECEELGRKPSARDLVARHLNKLHAHERSLLLEVLMLNADMIPMSSLFEMCKLLIDYGVNVLTMDEKKNTALHAAAERGFDRIGRLLITKGCPINAVNDAGDAAVHLAAKAGHTAVLEMLADLGANFHLRNGEALAPIDLAGYHSKDPGEREVVRRLMLSIEPRLRTLILYHPDFLDHLPRKRSEWEGPDRLEKIMTRLRDRQEYPDFEIEISGQFDKADVALLGRVHSPEYLSFVHTLSKQIQTQPNDNDGNDGVGNTPTHTTVAVPFTPHVQRAVYRQNSEELKSSELCDTSFSKGTLNAARRAAGAVAHAVDRVMLGRNRNAFCVVRPPGHHAGYNGLLEGASSCGFCIFNNVAAGAMHALEEHQCERVAIIDLDIHHGNGTEDIVRRYRSPSRLFFFSVHLYDRDVDSGYSFYPGTGMNDDHVHNVINVPLLPLWRVAAHQHQFLPPAMTSSGKSHDRKDAAVNTDSLSDKIEEVVYGREAYRRAILQRLIPSLRAFNPDLIFISAGFDAASGDVGNCKHVRGSHALGGMDLTPYDYALVTAEILKIADICCSGRVVSVLEGGYGEYAAPEPSRKSTMVTRTMRRGGDNDATSAAATSTGTNNSVNPLAESVLNRDILADAVAAHVHRLIDPYGPARLSINKEPFDHPLPTTASTRGERWNF